MYQNLPGWGERDVLTVWGPHGSHPLHPLLAGIRGAILLKLDRGRRSPPVNSHPSCTFLYIDDARGVGLGAPVGLG